MSAAYLTFLHACSRRRAPGGAALRPVSLSRLLLRPSGRDDPISGAGAPVDRRRDPTRSGQQRTPGPHIPHSLPARSGRRCRSRSPHVRPVAPPLPRHDPYAALAGRALSGARRPSSGAVTVRRPASAARSGSERGVDISPV